MEIRTIIMLAWRLSSLVPQQMFFQLRILTVLLLVLLDEALHVTMIKLLVTVRHISLLLPHRLVLVHLRA